MLDFDTTRLPTGAIGWASLFAAVERATDDDETQWLEFKAGIDPGTKAGAAALAKAIVAFANRDPALAQRWLGGHALILVGIGPGVVPGATAHDPSHVHNQVQRLLSSPPPRWDFDYHQYKDQPVLVVTVDPPQQGDPIYCIGKSSESVEDGNIYVRRTGKSDRARSHDIQALSTRLQLQPTLDLDVTAEVEGGQRRCTWPDTWLDDWLAAERRRLLKPLEDDLNPSPPTSPFALNRGLADFARFTEMTRGIRDPLVRTVPEDREPEEYRSQVEEHLEKCREALTGAEHDAMVRALEPVTWTITNLSADNLENVKLDLHVEGDVCAYTVTDYFTLWSRVPRPPQAWGPREVSLLPPNYHRIATSALQVPAPRVWQPGPSGPTVTNGGSVLFEFEPVHLRPHAREDLGDDHVLVVSPSVEGPVRCTWTATATNLSGVAGGEFTIPVATRPLDISGLLAHRPRRPRRGIRPGQAGIEGDGWEPDE